MSRSVRVLDRPGDDDLLQALLETDPGYAERVTDELKSTTRLWERPLDG